MGGIDIVLVEVESAPYPFGQLYAYIQTQRGFTASSLPVYADNVLLVVINARSQRINEYVERIRVYTYLAPEIFVGRYHVHPFLSILVPYLTARIFALRRLLLRLRERAFNHALSPASFLWVDERLFDVGFLTLIKIVELWGHSRTRIKGFHDFASALSVP